MLSGTSAEMIDVDHVLIYIGYKIRQVQCLGIDLEIVKTTFNSRSVVAIFLMELISN